MKYTCEIMVLYDNILSRFVMLSQLLLYFISILAKNRSKGKRIRFVSTVPSGEI